jgi:hypothetical protein
MSGSNLLYAPLSRRLVAAGLGISAAQLLNNPAPPMQRDKPLHSQLVRLRGVTLPGASLSGSQ